MAKNLTPLETDLLASLKETRDAAAYLMRFIAEQGVADKLPSATPFEGFSKRSDEVIARAEAWAVTASPWEE